MMNATFLDKLVGHLFQKYSENLSEIVIVLPNKRARVFLLDKLKSHFENYFFAPKIISIEEFVEELSGVRSIDNIELLFEFYQVYLQLSSKETAQNFDQFSNWAKTLLQDFNEIDRYLIEPNYVFSYLKDIEVLKRWDLSVEQKTELIEKQLIFWDKLPEYYQEFYNHLLTKGLGYQGLIYREAVNHLEFFSSQLQSEKIIFAGFNALNQAEERIIQHLLAVDKAEILWDIDKTFLNDFYHDVGLFIRRFKEKWIYFKNNPFEWIIDEFSQQKNIEIIGTSRSIGQAKIVSNIISDLTENSTSLDKVAVVLGDENLLIPTLHSLPSTVGSLNITMGYSAKNNPIQVFINKLFKMHVNAVKRNQNSYVFYYRDVLDVLNNPIIESYINVTNLVDVIKKNNYTFITHHKLLSLQEQKSNLFDLIFQKWNEKPDFILENISKILLVVKQNLDNENNDDKILKTFLYAIFKVINKLISYCSKNNYVENLDTLFSIYKQVIDVAEVSFEGEPLSGLQIMGVLESRVLDFETVIITSMNEGKFPAGKSTNSFIPYDVKREIGLPTFKEKDAIYTYHFYHLLLRAKNIYLIYNTENDGLDGGEKSRFITQLEVEKQPSHIIRHKILQPEIPNIAYEKQIIPKSDAVLKRLHEIASDKGFSPSALTAYIRNPIQFYFQRLLSIRETEEVEENIALNTLGTIIHKTLEELYKPYLNKFLSVSDIDFMISMADNEVLRQFKEEYKEGEVTKGKNLLAFEVAKRNIFNFLKEEKRDIVSGDVVKVIAVETSLKEVIHDDRLPFPITISGNVDRIEIRNNFIRIIDYKTGKVEQTSLRIKDWNGLTLDIKNEKIIQLLCYALMYQNELGGKEMEVGIISFKNMKAGFMPFQYQFEKEKFSIISSEIIENFKSELINLIVEILDSSIPFEEKV
ncbi:PD-(D/E)XK nuclease family protein [Flavobacterium sp. H122]|uniref:PD-(D/E)XK nuclease family protein n=1 Tax=Flavobacterium sp. H122 TaxID=2529860 RepID=UPI0010AA8AA8|nr:PD-(D/E)XK nuclease family protein [Flavobacterium sp. H122]